jgi:aminoglycoside 3-N-acetyltransferase
MPVSAVVIKQDIEDGLAAIGIRAGDTVLLHSSLSSFGHVEGGAATVIAALQAVLGERGCLVVPTLTLGMDEAQVRFDVRLSPSHTGRITEVFRGLPGVWRSHHPFSSAAAWGHAARQATAYHDGTPCSLTSPYGQVYLRGGYSLFMGVGMASNTVFHVAEEIAAPAYLRLATFPDAVVVDEDGIERRVHASRFNCYQTGIRRHLERMADVFAAAGTLRHATVGSSRWTLLAACDNVELSLDTIRRRPELILEDSRDR